MIRNKSCLRQFLPDSITVPVHSCILRRHQPISVAASTPEGLFTEMTQHQLLKEVHAVRTALKKKVLGFRTARCSSRLIAVSFHKMLQLIVMVIGVANLKNNYCLLQDYLSS